MQIAKKCGFASQEYFSRSFSKKKPECRLNLGEGKSATGRRMVLRNFWRSMHLGKLDCRRGKPFSRRVQHDLPSPGTAEGQSRTAVAKRVRTGVFE